MIIHQRISRIAIANIPEAREANQAQIKTEIKDEQTGYGAALRARKRSCPSSTPVTFELDDDGNFVETTEATPAPTKKQHVTIELD